MNNQLHLWLARDRCEELLREAARWQLIGRLRRLRKPRGEPSRGGPQGAREETEVRLAHGGDAAQIARLLELRGAPAWVAFEESFLVAERGGAIVAVVRFRREARWFYLGFLATDPGVEEGPLATSLYSGARMIARDLGLRGIRSATPRSTARGPASEKGGRLDRGG